MLRDPLRYAHDEWNLGGDRLFNACCRYGRRDEDGGGIGTSLLDCVRDIGEDRSAQMFRTSFLGIRAAYNVGAVFDSLGCVEGALSAGLKHSFGSMAYLTWYQYVDLQNLETLPSCCH
jgi:hypothetical protein